MKYWLVATFCLLIIPCVVCHGLPHVVDESNPHFQQLKTYIETNVSSKYGQVALSVFIVSFPSIPVFFGLSFLGKLLKTKSDKHNFSDKLLNLLLAFACGTILGDVMLHMLPFLFSQSNEAHHHEEHGHDHSHDHHDEHEHDHDHHHGEEGDGHNHGDLKVPLLIIGGIVLFLFLEFLFMKLHKKHDHGHNHSHGHHGHTNKKEHKNKKQVEQSEGKSKEDNHKSDSKLKDEGKSEKKELAKEHVKKQVEKAENKEEEEEEHSAIPFLIGDFLHNFTDGIAIGAAYNVSLQMGLMSTFVIMIHELPHEIGDFAHLIKFGYSLQKILSTQFLTSLGALIGGFLGLAGGTIYKTELLSVTAGGFLYMCLAQVIPEILQDLHKHHSVYHMLQIIVMIMLGVGLMYGVTLIE